MERLTFSDSTAYNGLEAAIHSARYSIVRPMCSDKRVLDVACGEGYGCHLMSAWGARHVDGVDVSAEAVEGARRLFGSDTVYFTKDSAERIDEVFATRSFDLIVSLETIEHVEDPARFLTGIKRLISRAGIIVISCPNDWWYYPSADQANPFHRRKYRFEEFQKLTEQILGSADSWYLGAPVSGFANVPIDAANADVSSGQRIMLQQQDMLTALLLPAEFKMGPTPETCSYFVGVWGLKSHDVSAAILPLSMNSFREDSAFSSWGPGRVNQLHSENTRLSDTLNEKQLELAAQATELSRLQRKAETASLEAERLSLTLQAEECDRQRFLVQLKRAQLDRESSNGKSPFSLIASDSPTAYQPVLEIVAGLQRETKSLRDEVSRARSTAPEEAVIQENRKLAMLTHALTQERDVMRDQIERLRQEAAEERDVMRREIERLYQESEDIRKQQAETVNNLGNQLWLLEAQTAVYRKLRSRIPSWIAPTVRRWARFVTR
jgi:SAM-dependent methyltransferase